MTGLPGARGGNGDTLGGRLTPDPRAESLTGPGRDPLLSSGARSRAPWCAGSARRRVAPTTLRQQQGQRAQTIAGDGRVRATIAAHEACGGPAASAGPGGSPGDHRFNSQHTLPSDDLKSAESATRKGLQK